MSTSSNFDPQKKRIGGIWKSDIVAQEENQGNGTYDYYLDMNGFRKVGLQFELTGTISIKIYGTIQDDGTAQNLCSYQEITSSLTGASSITSSSMILDDAELTSVIHYLKITVTCSGGGTDDYTIYSQRLY